MYKWTLTIRFPPQGISLYVLEGLLAVLLLWFLIAFVFLKHEIRWNTPLPAGGPHAERRTEEGSGALVVLCFSGGGKRASAFSFGVLEHLRQTRSSDGKRRLIDDVDAITAVSGGSFSAAFFGLHGESTFTATGYHGKQVARYEAEYLRPDTYAETRLAWIARWPVLWFTPYDRNHVLADHYDRALFDGATFGRLPRKPKLFIYAANMLTGERFEFTQENFSRIGSDLASYPLSYAVAASSAFPGLNSPISLENFARPKTYVHLVDAGVEENLGLGGVADAIWRGKEGWDLSARLKSGTVREFIVISVDAAPSILPLAQREKAERGSNAPHFYKAPLFGINAIMDRYRISTVRDFQDRLRSSDWKQFEKEHGFVTTFVHLGFEDEVDPVVRERLRSIPTGFALPDGDIDLLIKEGKDLLAKHRQFDDFLQRWKRNAEAKRVEAK